MEEWAAELEWAVENNEYEYANQVRAILGQEPGPVRPEPEPEPSFLDNWGRPIAEAGGSLVGGAFGIPAGLPGIMAGAALGGHAAGMGYDYLSGSPAPSIQDQVLGAAFNSMGGPTPAPPVGSITGRALIAGDAVPESRLIDRAAREADLPPLTPGQRGSTTGQVVEGWLESSPTGAPSVYRQRDAVEESMRSYIDDIFPTELTRVQSGQAITEGVQEAASARKSRAGELYEELYGMIDPEGRIDLKRSAELLERHKTRLKTDPEYARLLNTDPDVKRYVEALESAGVGGDEAAYPLYDTIKQFRTNVGSKIDDPFITASGGVQGEKRNLYGVLSDDLAQGAEDIGGEAARQARSRADWFNRGLMDRLERIDPIFKNVDRPERVYDAMEGMALRDVEGLRAVKKTLPDNVWEDFTNTYFRRLLRARPGAQNELGDAISYSTMATNLNKLKSEAPEAYKLLAGESAAALDNIQVLANRFKDSERFFNRSRTASANALSDMGRLSSDVVIGGGLGALVGRGDPALAAGSAAALVGGHMLLPWITSKVMTSPTIRKAVERIPFSAMKDVTTAKDLGRALVAAGADESEVLDLFNEGEPTSSALADEQPEASVPYLYD